MVGASGFAGTGSIRCAHRARQIPKTGSRSPPPVTILRARSSDSPRLTSFPYARGLRPAGRQAQTRCAKNAGHSLASDRLRPHHPPLLRDRHYQIDLKTWARYYFYGHKIMGLRCSSRRTARSPRGQRRQLRSTSHAHREAEGADAASRGSQGGNARHTGPADLTDRSGCSLDGDPAEAHMKFHVAFCRAARRVLFRLCQGS
jgi:hypothetical protein